MSTADEKTFVGVVGKGLCASGSKSERAAAFLDADAGRLLLRSAGAPAFATNDFDQFVNRRVRVSGSVHQGVLLVNAITLIREG